MAQVPQVRVLQNVLGLGVLCALAVWLGRDHLWEHAPGVGLGVAAVAYNPFLALPLGMVLLASVVGTSVFSSVWITYLGSSGLAALGVLTGALLRYERSHGPVYYQYTNEGWSGAEGLVYQRARVVQPLAPAGKVTIQGVLWHAVSLSGERIETGAQVEVIATERLTLYVDRLPPYEENKEVPPVSQ
jgi:membrane-bound ClpP family serine protease